MVFLSQETSADVVVEALSARAWGYVEKTKAASQLLALVEAVVWERGLLAASGPPVISLFE
jgi:DNA-binding NarL/FixJ family response regulator